MTGRSLGLKRFSPLYRIRRLMRERRDREFDKRMGVDTNSWVLMDQLDIPAPAKTDAGIYAPTPVMYFRRIVRNARINPPDFTFIDLGSGKGRALLLAQRAGFSRVIGVELDPKLCAIARANAQRWAELHPGSASIEIINGDARDFGYPAGNLLIYLYNPFWGHIFDGVLDKLVAAAEDPSREVAIIYNIHELGDRIHATGAFERRFLRPLVPWRRPTVSYYRAKRSPRSRD